MSTALDSVQICKLLSESTITLPDGRKVPRLGQGTWFMGEQSRRRASEIKSLRTGIELGMTLIDTAEMYGEGEAERVVGEAIRPIERDKLFLVSKVYPHNAGRNRIFNHCRQSIQRMGAGYLDLYLLHWRGGVPLSETVSCMEQLMADGLIRGWGVSNFDTRDMQELWDVPGGSHCAVNQVLYHLGSRGIEYDLLPWMREHQIPVMAYCPLAQAGSLRRELLGDANVQAVAGKYQITPVQVLLCFVRQSEQVIAIPKAASVNHVFENAQAALIHLTEEDMAKLSQSFPSPTRKMHLDIV